MVGNFRHRLVRSICYTFVKLHLPLRDLTRLAASFLELQGDQSRQGLKQNRPLP